MLYEKVIIIFIYVFKSNFIKCLYLIEKIKGMKENKINLFTKLQLDIMQRKIIESYQNEKYLEKRKLVYLTKNQRKIIKNTELFTANFNSINKLIQAIIFNKLLIIFYFIKCIK